MRIDIAFFCMAALLFSQQAALGETTAKPGRVLPSPTGNRANPTRFGDRIADEAFGAFQRGMYKTALTLALQQASAGEPNAQTLAAEIYARGLGVHVVSDHRPGPGAGCGEVRNLVFGAVCGG